MDAITGHVANAASAVDDVATTPSRMVNNVVEAVRGAVGAKKASDESVGFAAEAAAASEACAPTADREGSKAAKDQASKYVQVPLAPSAGRASDVESERA